MTECAECTSMSKSHITMLCLLLSYSFSLVHQLWEYQWVPKGSSPTGILGLYRKYSGALENGTILGDLPGGRTSRVLDGWHWAGVLFVPICDELWYAVIDALRAVKALFNGQSIWRMWSKLHLVCTIASRMDGWSRVMQAKVTSGDVLRDIYEYWSLRVDQVFG